MFLPAPPAEPEWMQPVMFYGKPLLFNPNNHRYTWDGKNVPSVTTILRRLNKPALIDWAANCAVDHILEKMKEWPEDYRVSYGTVANLCEEARKAHTVIRDKAGDVGTIVHNIARMLLNGAPWGDTHPPGLPEQASKALAAFEQWRSQHRIQVIDLERRVMSARYMYAGTCDFYGIIDDEPCILDFKTGGSDIYDETWYQIAGYERALREELPDSAPMVHWAVHLGKNTGECKAYRRGHDHTVFARNAWSHLVMLDKAIRAMPKMGRAA